MLLTTRTAKTRSVSLSSTGLTTTGKKTQTIRDQSTQIILYLRYNFQFLHEFLVIIQLVARKSTIP